MRAEIITIGDELLIGQVVDTNSAWMARRLNQTGISLYQITSVHDDKEHIQTALRDAMLRADIVLTTGGLGPTKDDITKQVLCDFFHTRLVPSPEVEQHVKSIYKDRPQVLNRLTATQWLVPESAIVLPNRIGSAPLMLWDRDEHIVAAMPGVPHEMEVAMDEQILPYLNHWLEERHINTRIYHLTLTVKGIPESALALQIEDFEDSLPEGMHLAYLPKDGKIRLRLSSYGECNEEQMHSRFEQLKQLVANYLVETE